MHHKDCNCGCRKPYKNPVSSRTIVISSGGESAYDIWLKYNPELDPSNNTESPWTEEYWLENYVKGTGSDKNYIHYQYSPSQYWNISHPLNKKVSVEITDSAGTVIEGLVTINDGNHVVIQFNSPFSGEAWMYGKSRHEWSTTGSIDNPTWYEINNDIYIYDIVPVQLLTDSNSYMDFSTYNLEFIVEFYSNKFFYIKIDATHQGGITSPWLVRCDVKDITDSM